MGRSQDCALVLDHSAISRHHARLRRGSDGGYEIEDLGSAHGTEVNGRRIQSPTPLAPGDRIAFANGQVEIRVEFEDGATRRGLLVAAGLGALILLALLAWPRPHPALERAQRLVDRALVARERSDWPAVRRELRSAAGLLYQAGLLDDLPETQPVQAAMQKLSAERDEDLPALLDAAHRALLERRLDTPATTTARCRLDRAEPDTMLRCLRVEVDFVLGELGQPRTTVPDRWLPRIAAQLADRRAFFESILGQQNEVVPLLEAELEAGGVSPYFHYLAFIESAYRNRARSHAGAVGVWQFIPSTARRYSLEVTSEVDQRQDTPLATRAAAAYLTDLLVHFGDFEGTLLLAIAGYNYGEHKVDRALRRLDNPFGASPYWELVERGFLPRETADYAPRFLAAAVAGESGLPSAIALRKAGFSSDE